MYHLWRLPKLSINLYPIQTRYLLGLCFPLTVLSLPFTFQAGLYTFPPYHALNLYLKAHADSVFLVSAHSSTNLSSAAVESGMDFWSETHDMHLPRDASGYLPFLTVRCLLRAPNLFLTRQLRSSDPYSVLCTAR
jgi:hypothetical protein